MVSVPFSSSFVPFSEKPLATLSLLCTPHLSDGGKGRKGKTPTPPSYAQPQATLAIASSSSDAESCHDTSSYLKKPLPKKKGPLRKTNHLFLRWTGRRCCCCCWATAGALGCWGRWWRPLATEAQLAHHLAARHHAWWPAVARVARHHISGRVLLVVLLLVAPTTKALVATACH